ncbi:hypothetical protein Hanom_Chr11g00975991 [Helianthus anomalus]
MYKVQFRYNIRVDLYKSKLQKSSFMLTLDCKVCPLSSKSTKTVLDVCKLLHVMTFRLNSVNFYG